MKVSRLWLQDYFADPLPDADGIRDALTFHSSEVEEVVDVGTDVVLDVKVLPDRAGYALCHRGIATELAAALARPLQNDPFAGAPYEAAAYPEGGISISISNSERCARYFAVRMDDVRVGPSPDWLRTRLEAVGQRSINNIVDATNYAMLALGQPLHAFDAEKLTKLDGSLSIAVRPSTTGERITALGGVEYALPEGTTVIARGEAGEPLAIAGVKGGIFAEVTGETTSILLEAASFDPIATRRTAQALKLFTDASLRFQNGPSPELVGYGMGAVIDLITQIAGGSVVAACDRYPSPPAAPLAIHVPLARIESILGMPISADDAHQALSRLGLPTEVADGIMTITPPFWRTDLVRVEDLAEEVGRIIGYDRLPAVPFVATSEVPDQRRFRGIEKVRDILLRRGFSEISTQSFAEEGEVRLANPLQADKPFLRSSFILNMENALARAKEVAPLALGPVKRIALFEVGNVFEATGEQLAISLGYEPLTEKPSATLLKEVVREIMDDAPILNASFAAHGSWFMQITFPDADFESIGQDYQLSPQPLGAYQPFSTYPFALRDVAVWVPNDIAEEALADRIREAAGEYLVRIDRFDRFEKEGRVSYAFRLVFQSFERTLSDADLDPAMERVYSALRSQPGWEPR